MEGRRLAANVVKRNPDTSAVEVFEAGTVPPSWVAAAVANDDVWASEPDAVDGDVWDPEPTGVDDASGAGIAPAPEAPPRSGAGSGRAAWAAYADALGFEIPDNMVRDDIIALVEDDQAS